MILPNQFLSMKRVISQLEMYRTKTNAFSWLLMVFAISAVGCSKRQVYQKSYHLGQVAEASRTEPILRVRDVHIHTFQSGIQHVNAVNEVWEIWYLGMEKSKLLFEVKRPVRDGEYDGYVKKLQLKWPSSKVPGGNKSEGRVDLAGFEVRILKAGPDMIRFQVLREWPELRDRRGVDRFLRRVGARHLTGSGAKQTDSEANPGKTSQPVDDRGRLKY